jgi:integrase
MAAVFRPKWRRADGTGGRVRRWYVAFRDHEGRERRLPGFYDRGATRELGNKLDRLARLRAARQTLDAETRLYVESLPPATRSKLASWGLLDTRSHGESRPLREHLVEYEQALRDSGASADHVRKTVRRVAAVLDGTGAKVLSELSAPAVLRYLAERRSKPRSDGGLSAASSNHYLTALKMFARWLVRERRATENPLAHLPKLNPETDRRHVRRALEPDEAGRLLLATRSGPIRFGMAAESRYWLYRLALETGLRSNELRSLTAASFGLTGREPSVTVEARHAKNRRTATLPLRLETAGELRASLAGKAPAARVFPDMPPAGDVAAMFREDLAAARAGWLAEAGEPAERAERERGAFLRTPDDSGRVLDFHSTRVSFATFLAAVGIPLKVIMELGRWSTPQLALKTYARTLAGSLGDAVGRLPDFAAPGPAPLRATGTTDTAPICIQSCIQSRDSERVTSSHRGARPAAGADTSKPAVSIEKNRARTCTTANAEGGTRTHTPLRERDFESLASANSATSAFVRTLWPARLGPARPTRMFSDRPSGGSY